MTPTIFLLVLLSGMLHAAWNFAARRAGGDLRVLWAALWLGALLGTPLLFSAANSAEGWRTALPFLALSAAFNAGYFFLVGKSYEEGEISIAYPAARGIGIAGITVAAIFLWRETPTPRGALGIAAIASGILALGLHAGGRPGGLRTLGLAACTGVLIAAGALTDRSGSRTVSPGAYVVVQYVLTALFLTPRMLRGSPPGPGGPDPGPGGPDPGPGGPDPGLDRGRLAAAALIGGGSLASYSLALIAMRFGPLSYVVAVREVAVVIGALLGILALGETFTARKGVGIAAIVGGLVLIRLA